MTIRSAPAASAKHGGEALGRCRGRSAGAAPRRRRPRASPSSPKPFEETIWSGPGLLAGHHQLVAGRDQRDDRAARDRDPARRSSRRGARGRPGASRRGAAMRAPAAKSPPAGRMWGSPSRPARRVMRVAVGRRRPPGSRTSRRPSGTGAPVKMRTASPGPTRAVEARAGGGGADDARGGAPAAASAARHGVAVHRRGGEGRLGAGGDDVARRARGRRRRRAAPPRRRAGRRARISRACASATGSSAIRAPRSARTCRLP